MLVWLDSPQAAARGFILIDRDGVVNENRPDYVKNVREFHAYPDALQALALLNRRNISAIIISNQSGINRGLISWDDFWQMHDAMISEVEQSGGKIAAALYCPHRPDELCGCRKPSPDMISAACRLFEIDPRQAIFIGDSITDIEAAANAGCLGIRIRRTDEGSLDVERGSTQVFSNLADAVLGIYP